MSAFVFGWRDGILLLVVLVALYLVVSILKLLKLGRRPESGIASPDPGIEDTEAPSFVRMDDDFFPREAALSDGEAVNDRPTPERPMPFSTAVAVSAYTGETTAFGVAAPPVPEADIAPPARFLDENVFEDDDATHRGGAGGFGESLAEHLARTDMEMEVQRMRDEVDRIRAEMEQLRAAQRVSPHYAEAMELVQRGMLPRDVADHLGISLAEAELVRALSRGEANFDEGEAYGEQGYAANDGYAGRGQGRQH